MDILPEIQNRRSVRKYQQKDVSDEQIELLLKAASLAPSGSNKQPWDFIVVRSAEMKEKICMADHNQKWMLTAPVFIVCVGNETYRGDGDMERVIRDSSIAATTLLFQAEHMGLSACWTGWFTQDEMKPVLNLSENHYVTAVITIGYSDTKSAAVKRRELKYKVI